MNLESDYYHRFLKALMHYNFTADDQMLNVI